MEDLRKTKSKELLKDAFWNILKTKKYAQIYIKDIVEYAGVNRKTFTAHYESVDALMRDCIEELIQKLLIHLIPIILLRSTILLMPPANIPALL